MFDVLLRAFSFAFIVLLGIILRSSGLMPADAGAIVKKILIYVTLPAAIVVNFSAISEMESEMILLAVLGIVVNVVMIGVGLLYTRNKAREEQVLQMLCLPAFNIGAFCLPFVQSFLPSLGVVTACMFDVGNSIMCTGGTYAFVAEYTAREKKGLDVKSFVGRLITSPPLMTYVVMFTLALVGIHLPQPVIAFITPISTANTFVAMLMLGLLFHLELKQAYIGKIVQILTFRHVFAAVCALAFYYLLPFELVIRQALVLVCFAPLSAVAPAYVGMCDGDEGMASCVNSLSILCSLVTITVLLAVLGLN